MFKMKQFFMISLLLTAFAKPAFALEYSCKSIPDYKCLGSQAYCGEILPFNPVRGLGYFNYPLNSETLDNQYRSYARRDLIMLVRYATAWTYCLSEGWAGNGGELGLGDMSEIDGSIPGTSDGRPGHPKGTHIKGKDMDIAYYQTANDDNLLRPICEHVLKGKDQYHCVAPADTLDVRRSALFIGLMHHSSQLRVIGVDGLVGPAIESTLDELCQEDLLVGNACSEDTRRLAYETENEGQGWFKFHHHHLHVSLTLPKQSPNFMDDFRNDMSIVPLEHQMLDNH